MPDSANASFCEMSHRMSGIRRYFDLAYRTIFGFDYFISYTWRDKADANLGYGDECARNYAVKLRNALRKQQFVCFLDSDDYAKGQNWRWFGQRALQGTSRLILVLSPAVSESQAVLDEVEYFKTTGKAMVPVEFNDCPHIGDTTRLLSLVESETLRIREPASALREGPTDYAIGELVKTFTITRQNDFRRRLLWSTIGVLATLLVAVALIGRLAIIERDHATNELAHAQFALGRVPFDQHKYGDALLWFAKSCSTTHETDWRDSMLNLIGPWAATLPQRFEANDSVVSVSMNLDSKRLLVAGGKVVQLWDVANGELIGEPMKHAGFVTSAVFHSDGQRVLTANNAERTGDNAEILIWKAPQVGEISKVAEPQRLPYEGRLTRAEYSPDGQLILAWGDHGIRLFDSTTLQPIGIMSGSQSSNETLTHALVSPDSRTIVTAEWNGSLQFWDAQTGRMRGTGIGHERRILAMAYSPDGKMLVTGGEDQTTRLWNVETCELFPTPLKHEHSVTQVGFSPDGQSLFTASEGRETGVSGEAALWDVSKPTSVAPIGKPLAIGGNVSCFVFSPDGQKLLTGSDTFWIQKPPEARIWSVGEGNAIGEAMLHGDKKVSHVAFSPDGHWIMTAGSDGTARIWDVENTAQYGPTMQHDGFVTTARISIDGSQILTACNSTAFTWDLKRQRPLIEPISHGSVKQTSRQLTPDGRVLTSKTGSGSPVMALSFDDRWIITGGNDKAVGVYDACTGESRFPHLTFPASVSAVEWSPDASKFLTVSENNVVQIWRADCGQPCGQPLRHEAYVRSAEFSSDGQTILTCCRDYKARLFDSETGKLLFELAHDGEIAAAVFSPDGRSILSACGKEARMWSVPTGHAVGQPLLHEGNVSTVAFSSDGSIIATAGEDKFVRLWYAESLLPIGKPLEHSDAVSQVAFGPNCKTLLSAVVVRTSNRLGEARLWDVRTGKQLVEPFRHKGNITAIDFTPDGQTLLTGSRDATVQLWDARTGLPRGNALTHFDAVMAARFSHDGTKVVTSSQTNTVQLWAVPMAASKVHLTNDAMIHSLEHLTGTRLDSNGEIKRMAFEEMMTMKSTIDW